MKQSSDNPSGNKLPESANETNLIRAIEESGYPLQGLVADKLKHLFFISEEWGYIDRDTNNHRSLDVFAHKYLIEKLDSPVVPGVVLLTECKRSVHPYIFFKNVTDPIIPKFPAVAGLSRGIVRIYKSSNGRYRDITGAKVLGIDKHPFVENSPPICSAFSRATLSGQRVELSGKELYNNLVLPLVNAFDHTYSLYKYRSSRMFPRLVLLIGVLDAPMILVESPSQASAPVLTPWIRIVRQESDKSPGGMPFKFYGIDVVHIDYLDEFISKHLMPFIEEFGQRVEKMSEIILNGGEVEDLDNWSWDEIRAKKK